MGDVDLIEPLGRGYTLRICLHLFICMYRRRDNLNLGWGQTVFEGLYSYNTVQYINICSTRLSSVAASSQLYALVTS